MYLHKPNKNVKGRCNSKDRVARSAIDRPSSISYSTNLSRPSRKNLSARAIDSRAHNSFSTYIHAHARAYTHIRSRHRLFTIPQIVQKFQSDGRTNVANTFCNSYRAIPRPSGNAKIDFPENYVRDLASADIHIRAQRRTFAYTYTRNRIRTRFHTRNAMRIKVENFRARREWRNIFREKPNNRIFRNFQVIYFVTSIVAPLAV